MDLLLVLLAIAFLAKCFAATIFADVRFHIIVSIHVIFEPHSLLKKHIAYFAVVDDQVFGLRVVSESVPIVVISLVDHFELFWTQRGINCVNLVALGARRRAGGLA